LFGSELDAIAPDPDWVLPFEATEESPALWRVTAKRDLSPGEYGWYVNFKTGPQGGTLFDCGVD